MSQMIAASTNGRPETIGLTVTEITALKGNDPALAAFRRWIAARDALIEGKPEGKKEDAKFRALINTNAAGPAGIAALASAAAEVFGGDEPVLDALLARIISSAIEQDRQGAASSEPEPAREKAKAEPSSTPPWVRVSEAPKFFGISKATLYRAAQRGEIKIYKSRGSRVKTEEIERWLAGDAESAE